MTTVPIERRYKGSEYDFRITIEQPLTDHFATVGKKQISIYRYNAKVNKIIHRFLVADDNAKVLLEAIDAANTDGRIFFGEGYL